MVAVITINKAHFSILSESVPHQDNDIVQIYIFKLSALSDSTCDTCADWFLLIQALEISEMRRREYLETNLSPHLNMKTRPRPEIVSSETFTLP